MKINKIDKKILRELGNNARLSYKELAKKINSKKEIVAYHINKMEREGVIKKYIPVFSQARLGVFVHKIYMRFQGLSKEKENEMVKEFAESPYVNWMAKSVGTWDLMIAFYCRNILEFAKRKNDLLFKKYGRYIQDYNVSILEDALIYTRDYLINSPTRDRPGLIYGGSITEEKIDDNHFIVSVKEPPVKGQINEAIKKAISKFLKTKAYLVRIVSGRTSRQKIIEIINS